MSEIDTRIENLERELEALKAAREAEKSSKFEIEGDVRVGMVFPTRDGDTVEVVEVLDPKTAAFDFEGSRIYFRGRNSIGEIYYYNETGLIFPGMDRYDGDDIVGQSPGVKVEVGGVYLTREGHVAIVLNTSGDATYPYIVRVVSSEFYDCFKVMRFGARWERVNHNNDLVERIGIVDVDKVKR